MTIDEKQQEIIDEFGMFDDWMDKYNYLIEISKDLPEMETKNKVDENLIEGCQSKVWLNAKMQDDKLVFTADSDAIITKGIIALLIQVLSGRKPQEIKDANLYFIDEIGLKENLSPTRSNGLLAMVNKIKAYALAYDLKQNQ
ncbi:MAG TPA: SufE family protein [Bacteroidales bacterium]|nr:SufE family protein [Bacteroidales bacterium]